jgi:hypothetical protein
VLCALVFDSSFRFAAYREVFHGEGMIGPAKRLGSGGAVINSKEFMKFQVDQGTFIEQQRSSCT